MNAICVEGLGHVRLMTIDRPHVMNAIDAAASTELGIAVSEANSDPLVKAIVITGRGDRAFCAGADLMALQRGESVAPVGREEWGFAGVIHQHIEKPMIAAINGLAYGGGLELALACDLLVASQNAQLALPEVKRGIIAAGGGLVRLPRQIPVRLALQLALTGEPIDAVTAQRWGLVNWVRPQSEVLEFALNIADMIAHNSPTAVRASKTLIWMSQDPEFSEEDLWSRNDRAGLESLKSEDAIEGMLAFAEKRAANWPETKGCSRRPILPTGLCSPQ